MSSILPVITMILSLILGLIIVQKLSIALTRFSNIFFAIVLGVVLFTAINYLSCLIFSFPEGVILAHIEVTAFILLYFLLYRPKLHFRDYLLSFRQEKLLLVALFFIGILLVLLFHTHIIPNINGD